jgi:hypothetical protein
LTEENYATLVCPDCNGPFQVHVSDLSKLESPRCVDCERNREIEEDRYALDRSDA